jgi:hypothetical protein
VSGETEIPGSGFGFAQNLRDLGRPFEDRAGLAYIFHKPTSQIIWDVAFLSLPFVRKHCCYGHRPLALGHVTKDIRREGELKKSPAATHQNLAVTSPLEIAGSLGSPDANHQASKAARSEIGFTRRM